MQDWSDKQLDLVIGSALRRQGRLTDRQRGLARERVRALAARQQVLPTQEMVHPRPHPFNRVVALNFCRGAWRWLAKFALDDARYDRALRQRRATVVCGLFVGSMYNVAGSMVT